MNYSSFLNRFLGTAIDSIIILVVTIFLNRTIPLIGWILSLSFGFFYYPFFWASEYKATPGKYIIGTTIVSITGERLTIKQAFIRYLCSWLSSTLLGFGYLLMLFTDKKQTLHDIIAGTVSVDDKITSENNLFQAWINEIKWFFNNK